MEIDNAASIGTPQAKPVPTEQVIQRDLERKQELKSEERKEIQKKEDESALAVA